MLKSKYKMNFMETNPTPPSIVNTSDKGLTQVFQVIFSLLVIIGAAILFFKGYQCIDLAQEVHAKYVAMLEKHNSAQNIAAMNLSAIKDGYAQSYSYFMLGLGAIVLVSVLPRIASFGISPTGVTATLKQLSTDVAEIKAKAIQQEERLRNLK
jgi:hypothetical protein